MGTPLLKTEDLTRLLGQTDLRDAPCEALRAPSAQQPSTVVVHLPAGGDVLAAWRRLRALVPRTGRYPLVVLAEAQGLGLDEDRARALRMAPLVDLDEDDRLQLENAALEEMEMRQLQSRIERHAQPPRSAEAFCWRHPQPHLRYAIALPPVATMWEAALHLPWRGAVRRQDLLAALLRDWERRFGAELVLALPDTLQFSVRRPPGSPKEAFALAVQQHCLAPQMLPAAGIAPREHARWLLTADRWRLSVE